MALEASHAWFLLLVLVNPSSHVLGLSSSCCTGGGETNIALNRPTKQSSTYSNEISYHAVDGNTDGVQGHGSCTHTENTNEAWWRVDLGSAKRVKRVVIYNRLGSFGSRLHNFDIHVGDSLLNNGNDNAKCATSQSLSGRRDREIYCIKPLIGRYLNIKLRGSNYLSLCEVKVFSN